MSLFKELIVDNFAGGGGASSGIEMATGRSVDIAIDLGDRRIVPGFVDLHGAKIELYSEPNKGTRFECIFQRKNPNLMAA